jgi:alpha-L-arabinofuranosidase
MTGYVRISHRTRSLHRWWAVFTAVALLGGSISLSSATARASTVTGDVINVNASSPTGIIQPTETGQTMEVASDEMNGAWAQEVQNRELQTDQVSSAENSTLYDGFTEPSLDTSLWTPMSLNDSSPGTITEGSGEVSITEAEAGRYGIMSNDIPDTRYANVSISTEVQSYTGQNAIMDLYGGTGAGDFSDYVEFGIEDGVLKVWADGESTWVGGTATTPAVLKAVVSPLGTGDSRNFDFYYNGTLVDTLSGFTLTPAPFRVFLYGWTGTATFDYLNVNPDDTYDSFVGSSLSPRWTPTSLAGGTGSVSVGDGELTIDGAADSRYGVLSQPIDNSSTDVTTVGVTLDSVDGTNGLIDLYSGTGAGDFANFLEFGVQGGDAVIYTPSGVGNWTGGAVSLPATLSMEVGTWGPAGRWMYFFVNGEEVHEFDVNTDITAPDFQLFLYGYGATTTVWDDVTVSQVHMFDRTDAGFDPEPSAAFDDALGVPTSWTETSLAGGWGSAVENNSEITIDGAADSRFGLLSSPLDQSDAYGYTVQAKLDAISGTNGLLDIYAGTGNGDFSNFLEFGVQGGDLVSYGDGLSSWTGPAVSLPVVLRIEVGPWTSSGRNVFFFANGQLEYEVLDTTVIPDQPYNVFIYGYGDTTTSWDYVTWWETNEGIWQADGYADQATYTHDYSDPFNGKYDEEVTDTQSNGGLAGISQNGLVVDAGYEYAVSVYLRESDLSSAVTVSIGPDTGMGSSYSPYASTTFSDITGTWTKYSATLTSSTTDDNAKLFVGIGGTGSVYIAMVSVMPLNSAQAVDGGWNTSFVDALEAMHIGAIRWPGGIISDWYNWQDGVGPTDDRPPMFFGQFEAEWMTNDVGTNEILALGKALGVPVILGVDVGTPVLLNDISTGAEEAADWVQYVNGSTSTTYGAERAADGYSTPWDVQDWEIGNESWGNWEPGWTAGTGQASNSGSPPGYAQDFLTYQSAMEAQDSSIDFLATGGAGNVNDQSWNAAVLQAVTDAGSTVGALSLHYYTPQSLPADFDPSEVYEASVAASLTIQSDLNDTVNTIEADTTNDTKGDVTEYNAMFLNEPTELTRSLEGGLEEGAEENMLLREPDIAEINTASTLVNFWDGSSIRLSNRGSFETPGGLIESIIDNNFGPQLIPNTVTTGTYSVGSVGDLPAQSAVPYLDATTTMSANGSQLYISVINRDPSNDHETTIDVSGAGTIGSSASYEQVDSSSYLDQNTWQDPDLISTTSGTIDDAGSSFTFTFPAHSYTEITLDTDGTAISGPEIIGEVTNSSGTPISGATVETNTALYATTNSSGYYEISAPAGTYSLTASDTGYTSYTETGVQVSSVGETPLPISLSS